MVSMPLIYISDAGAPVLNYGKANINMGTGETNLITAIAQGSHISFYINKQFVIAIDNNTFHTGSIGFTASTYG